MKIYIELIIKKINLDEKIVNRARKSNSINRVTFGDEIENIKNNILFDVGKCNAKIEKDIIIIIDLNKYNNN